MRNKRTPEAYSSTAKKAEIQNPNDARQYGIETIYQELALCGNLDAPSNLFMGRESEKLGLLNQAYMRSETDSIVRRLGIKIKSLNVEVERLSGGQRQSIAIGRAVYFEAKILIMDEPTAALGMEETKPCHRFDTGTQKKRIGIFWISHDIHDIYAFTDRIAILKGGRNVVTCETKACSQDEIVSMIISGRPARSLRSNQVAEPVDAAGAAN